MSNTTKMILVAGLGLAGYFAFKKLKSTQTTQLPAAGGPMYPTDQIAGLPYGLSGLPYGLSGRR